ncbi:UNVERIFIED_CONTAM: hypothetical protein HDU68_001100 [Siphonaria sp. JEL0065]|nr:hypothetical protein HDU68_001100 [Siphonaria sp. JEL0065]
MFKKAVHIKSTTNLRSSDAKKLKSEVISCFNVDQAQCEKLFGNHQITKATLEIGTLYSANTVPLFIRVEVDSTAILIPTLYALYNVPTLLPLVLTHSSVASRLINGADLMLPGVFGVSNPSTLIEQKTSETLLFPALTPVQIVIKQEGRLTPIAVGIAKMSSGDILKGMRVSKGVACLVAGVVGDGLFQLGDGVVPSDAGITVQPLALSVEDLDLDDEEEDNNSNAEEEIIVQDIDAQSEFSEGGFVVVDKAMSLSSSDSVSEFDMIQSVVIGAERLDSVSVIDTESIVKVPAPHQPEYTPAQVDVLLEQALLKCIKFSLPQEQKAYPLSATTLYSQHMLPILPPDSAADVKQSTHKKLQKFLKVMEKKGYLKVKERQQGGELVIVAVYRNHPEVAGLDMDEKAFKREIAFAAAKNSAPSPSGSSEVVSDSKQASSIEVVDIFKSTGSFIKLWQEIGIDKETTFTRASLKSATELYITKKELVNSANPRLVKIDPYLADTILAKDEYTTVDYLPRDAIYTRILGKMSAWHQVSVSGRDPVLRKGSCKPIQLIIEKRAGRKLVTRILGLESFLIDPDQLASDLKVPCASSTSVSVVGGGGVSGKAVAHEVLVQGSKVQEVCVFLRDRFGFVFGGGGKGVKLGVKGGKSLRKKCNKAIPTCDRCTSRGVSCSYRPAALGIQEEVVAIQVGREAVMEVRIRELESTVRDLSNRLIATEASLAAANEKIQFLQGQQSMTSIININSPNSDCLELEDPRMAATVQDWILMTRYYETVKYSVSMKCDPEFLVNFSMHSAARRLIMCALACLNMDPPLPKQVALDYYNRARKAVSRRAGDCTVDLMMANYLLSDFAMSLKPNTFGVQYRTNEVATNYYLSTILDIIRDTTRHHTTNIPRTVVDLLSPPKATPFRAQLHTFRSSTPSHLIISQENGTQFLAFTSTFQGRETVTDCLFLTMFYNVAICIMNRPILYLTKFLKRDSVHLTMENRSTIFTALNESLVSAQTVVGLASWLVHQSEMKLDGEDGKFRDSFWRLHPFESFVLFEAVVVLWFATTQTQEFWFEGITPVLNFMTLEDRQRIRSQVLDVLRTLKDLEQGLSTSQQSNVYDVRYGDVTNFVSPMVECIQRMLSVIEDVEFAVIIGEKAGSSVNEMEVEAVAIEMNVLSLTDTDPELREPYRSDPWVFLGLLGAQVKGMKWRAWYEEDWRLFWKKVAQS